MGEPIGFCAAKGRPGVTTSVLAVAGKWPGYREPYVVEADPAGGDLVLWLAALEGGDPNTLARTPCTVQLAAAAANLTGPDLLEYSQRLPGPGELRALVGPSSPFAASQALSELVAGGLLRELRALDRFDVLIDFGRLDVTAPTMHMVRALGEVVVVARAELGSLDHTAELVCRLREQFGVTSRLLFVGDERTADAWSEQLKIAVVGVLPDDPDAADALGGRSAVRRRLEKTRLIKAAHRVALTLAPLAEPPPAAPAAFAWTDDGGAA